MEMIQQSELVDYKCPNCGFVKKDKPGRKIICSKCDPDFQGWIISTQDYELSAKEERKRESS